METQQLLNEKITKNEEGVQKLIEKYHTDHVETEKQRYQIEQLYLKLGNGWSGKIQNGVEILQRRVNDLEKNNIQINNKLDNLSIHIQNIKDKPKATVLRVKDTLYITMAIITVGSVVLSAMGVL